MRMKFLGVVSIVQALAFLTLGNLANAASSPVWVSQVSDFAECANARADYSDIEAGKKTLTGAGIRVITTERNVHADHYKPGRKCGDTGGFVSCYLIFSDKLSAAKSLGFQAGGKCGVPFETRVH